MCEAAAKENPRRVYEVQTLATNKDIAAQAGRIKEGSGTMNDREAMTEILKICKAASYTPTSTPE